VRATNFTARGGVALGIKGPPIKKNSVTPVVGGWVKAQKRAQGQIYFFRYYVIVFFELPSPRNAPKRDKKKSRKSRFWTFGRIFLVNLVLDTIFLAIGKAFFW
jgi:hypothetical protein